MNQNIAVIDIGKTNAKLALVNQDSLAEIAVITRPNTVLFGAPWPHFDIEGHWAFLLDGLRQFHEHYGIDVISITTHGACVALLDDQGELAAPILDYEHSGPDEVAESYDVIRSPFAETGSPKLAGGLNVGAQLFWQFQIDPSLKERTCQILTYPQFWGAKLTGITAMDVTSLGCHTDLWNPNEAKFSSLVDTLGISEKLARVHKPHDVLGTVLPHIAKQTGLNPKTKVHCGIHDSNASLLPYILCETQPFSVVSTGTWVVAMSIGGKAVELNADLDCLMNVTAMGNPAPSARFMGGREHDVATGGAYPEPTQFDIETILSNEIMLMPAIAVETGPFKGHISCWKGDEPDIGTGLRGGVVAFYLALVSAECLSNIGHDGKIIVEGPFAGNQQYLEMLAAITGSAVHPSSGLTGTSAGAALLAGASKQAKPVTQSAVHVSADTGERLRKYAQNWRTNLQKKP